MTNISNNDIAHAIYLVSKDKDQTGRSLIFTKIIQFLVRRKLLSKTPDILARLDKIINKEEGRIVAKVSSKNKLEEKTKENLIHTLSKRYSAREVAIVSCLDEKLLGGLRVEVDDEVIDLTLKNRIGKLQEYLIKSV